MEAEVDAEENTTKTNMDEVVDVVAVVEEEEEAVVVEMTRTVIHQVILVEEATMI